MAHFNRWIVLIEQSASLLDRLTVEPALGPVDKASARSARKCFPSVGGPVKENRTAWANAVALDQQPNQPCL
jgi:hypothetical protein